MSRENRFRLSAATRENASDLFPKFGERGKMNGEAEVRGDGGTTEYKFVRHSTFGIISSFVIRHSSFG